MKGIDKTLMVNCSLLCSCSAGIICIVQYSCRPKLSLEETKFHDEKLVLSGLTEQHEYTRHIDKLVSLTDIEDNSQFTLHKPCLADIVPP